MNDHLNVSVENVSVEKWSLQICIYYALSLLIELNSWGRP